MLLKDTCQRTNVLWQVVEFHYAPGACNSKTMPKQRILDEPLNSPLPVEVAVGPGHGLHQGYRHALSKAGECEDIRAPK